MIDKHNPALKCFNKHAMRHALLDYYYHELLKFTPVNLNLDDGLCYNSVQSFGIQTIGKYHAENLQWTWAYLDQDLVNNSRVITLVQSLKQTAKTWNDAFIATSRTVPADDVLIHWFGVIAASYSTTGLYVTLPDTSRMYRHVLAVHDKKFLATIIDYHHKHKSTFTDTLKAVCQKVKRFNILLCDLRESVLSMCALFDITYVLSGQDILISDDFSTLVIQTDNNQLDMHVYSDYQPSTPTSASPEAVTE
ncbi:MAG: hypothetical protein VXZ73_00870 [Pseudomonadota bacterium]|nr:hypothetical protein [Pseudomonadota bacterium]